MLTQLHIRDFAIIDGIELELGPGMTALTGETGAGKSICVDALLLVTGARAGAEVVRQGSERAEITATFDVADNDSALAWLKEQEIEHEGECILRRSIGSDGRSRAWVNGQTMPIQALRQVGEALVDVHGQMEYQSLMRRSAQRELLDRHAAHDAFVQAVGASWKQLAALRAQLEQAASSTQDRLARLELLEYHVRELDALDLKPNEVIELVAERQRLAQSGRLGSGLREISMLLREAEDANAEQAIARASSLARQLVNIDSALGNLAKLVDEALISVREAVDEAARRESSLEADPSRQEWVETRLAAIESLARKHRVDPPQLHDLQQQLQRDLEQLRAFEQSSNELQSQIEAAARVHAKACISLSASRLEAAKNLSERVTSLMQRLGMNGGSFVVDLQSNDSPGPNGAEDVEFLVTTNAGQSPRPLAKTASGGELSRISLAIQVAAVETEVAPVLVFDEVDAGVGGAVAEIVGQQLRTLGERAQVLCVTHLPQVASQAHAHVRASKLSARQTTRTSLHVLNDAERIEEIARMLGGREITEKARAHAAEMLTVATTRPKKRGKQARA